MNFPAIGRRKSAVAEPESAPRPKTKLEIAQQEYDRLADIHAAAASEHQARKNELRDVQNELASIRDEVARSKDPALTASLLRRQDELSVQKRVLESVITNLGAAANSAYGTVNAARDEVDRLVGRVRTLKRAIPQAEGHRSIHHENVRKAQQNLSIAEYGLQELEANIARYKAEIIEIEGEQ